MNRTISEATGKRFHHDDRHQRRTRLADGGPDRSIVDPIHKTPGRNAGCGFHQLWQFIGH